jgi:hypothetical protein
MFGLGVGWFIIQYHTAHVSKVASQRVTEMLQNEQGGRLEPGQDVSTLLVQEKVKYVDNKTFFQRVFSYKMFHGVIMTLSVSTTEEF